MTISLPPIKLEDQTLTPMSPSQMNLLNSWAKRRPIDYDDWFKTVDARLSGLEDLIRALHLESGEMYAVCHSVQKIDRKSLPVHLTSGNEDLSRLNNISETGNAPPSGATVWLKVRAQIDNLHAIFPAPVNDPSGESSTERDRNRTCYLSEFYGSISTSKPMPINGQVVKVKLRDRNTSGTFIESTGFFIKYPGNTREPMAGSPRKMTIEELVPRAVV